MLIKKHVSSVIFNQQQVRLRLKNIYSFNTIKTHTMKDVKMKQYFTIR